MKVVLFNGPRTSGKDTLAREYERHIGNRHPVSILKMARPMHEAALAEYNLPPGMVDVFEPTKDQPAIELGGKTPRKVYIEYGTKIRAEHGQDILGRMWVERASQIMNYERGWLLVPDVRMQPEVNAAVRFAGRDNVMLVYVVRPGTTWDGDIGRFCEHDWSCTFINTSSVGIMGYGLERLLERAWQ